MSLPPQSSDVCHTVQAAAGVALSLMRARLRTPRLTSARLPPIPSAGYSPEPLYPQYSSDFFDGRHFVQVGPAGQGEAVLRKSIPSSVGAQ